MPRLVQLVHHAHHAAASALAAFALIASPASAQTGVAIPQVTTVMTEAGPIAVQRVADRLDHPWALAFLPDGRMLVTERTGKLRIVRPDGQKTDSVKGVPIVFAQGQGGLQDVALDPEFRSNSFVYLSYAMPGPEGSAATAVGRGRWQGDSLVDFRVIFRQEPWITGPNHFGSRLVFGPQGHLFVALGERFQFQPAQDLSNHLGTIVRLNRDGTVPRDNPFVGRPGVRPEIWSYGHRNIESAAIHPQTGALWVAEMGPLGGDELNAPEAGKNYGWPLVSWGIDYDGAEIPDPSTRRDLVDAVKVWRTVISPSGMAFYTGSAFPAWRNSFLIGGLSAHQLVRVTTDGLRVTGEERIPLEARIRDVEQGPDGMVYVVTDSAQGELWRLEPLPRRPARAR